MTKSLLQRDCQPENHTASSQVNEHPDDSKLSSEFNIAHATDNPCPQQQTTCNSSNKHNENTEKVLHTPAKRAGDSGLGRPIAVEMPVDPNSLSSIDTEDITENKSENDELVACSIYAPPWICTFLRTSLLFISAVAMFYIITQTAAFLANVRQLSLCEQIFLSILLAIFGVIILGVIIKILWFLFKLKVSPQIKIKALQELEKRKSLRSLCLKNKQEAVVQLNSFLQNSLLCNTTDMKKLGFSVDTIKSIQKQREKLIHEAEYPTGTSNDWINDFRENIQEPLDQLAQKKILRYSMNSAIMAGISPFSIIDRLIVLSACLSMLKELLQIYSLKPSWDKNLILMCRVVVNTYLAGITNDITEAGIDGLANMAEDTFSHIPEHILRWTGKATESAMQGYMVYRLGKSAMRALHPVQTPQDEPMFSTWFKNTFLKTK